MLVSWAVPKGPPTDGSSNHLAVQTEDHPMEYADFAGTIPRGEYGGGSVSIWDNGTYRLHKWRDGREVIATLFGRRGGGLGGVAKFALIHTGGGAGRPERNWLMHRMDTDPEDLAGGAQPTEPTTELPATVSPMRAGEGTVSRLDGDEWSFEMEWIGDRVTVYLAPGQVRVYDTTGTDRTEELTEVVAVLVGQTTGTGPLADGAVLDGVVVGARTLVLFDLMRLGRRSLLREPYRVRREVLTEVIQDTAGAVVQVPPGFDDDHEAALTAAAELGLQGVIAKKISSTYQPGRIARTWQRIAVPTGTSAG